MSLSDGRRIMIKVKADASKKKKEKDRPVFPAQMTPNRLHKVKFRESKYLIRSPRRGSVQRPTDDCPAWTALNRLLLFQAHLSFLIVLLSLLIVSITVPHRIF
jgi:hypothetical protein